MEIQYKQHIDMYDFFFYKSVLWKVEMGVQTKFFKNFLDCLHVTIEDVQLKFESYMYWNAEKKISL